MRKTNGLPLRGIYLFEFAFIPVVVFIMALLISVETQAAGGYHYQTMDRSKVFSDECTIKLDRHFTYVVLEGKTPAIRSINKTLADSAGKEMNLTSNAEASAIADSKNEYRRSETYCDYYNEEVTYQSKNVVSIKESWYWYAGGVSNTFEGGRVFDLKTGKEIKDITRCTKEKSLAKIKAILKNKINSGKEGYNASGLNKMKATDFEFYIGKRGNVVVCFGPYELGYGGWTKKYTLPGKRPI